MSTATTVFTGPSAAGITNDLADNRTITTTEYTYAGDVTAGGKRHGRGRCVYFSDQFAGQVYEGEYCNDVRHGRGVFRHTDGTVYEGEWSNGKMEGRGVMRYSDGSVYEGEFKDDAKDGKGKEIRRGGAVYEGDWRRGKMDGRGVYRDAEGGVYEGTFCDDLMDGRGVYRYSKGDVYDGDWKRGRQEGKGLFRSKAGIVYEGHFLNNKKEGQGVMKDPNGNVTQSGRWEDGMFVHAVTTSITTSEFNYQGDNVSGKRHGYGKCTWSSGEYEGRVYVGQWRNDLREGRGVCSWADGAVYEGEWKRDKKDGKGRMRFSDGVLFVGEWKNNAKHGHGVMTDSDGNVIQSGRWENDLIVCGGHEINTLDYKYVGDVVNGKREGKGNCTWIRGSVTGQVYEGDWKSDKMEGRGTYWYANGNIYEGGYKGDKKEGVGMFYWSDGLAYEGEWKGDLRHGQGLMKDASGNVTQSGSWVDGQFKG